MVQKPLRILQFVLLTLPSVFCKVPKPFNDTLVLMENPEKMSSMIDNNGNWIFKNYETEHTANVLKTDFAVTENSAPYVRPGSAIFAKLNYTNGIVEIKPVPLPGPSRNILSSLPCTATVLRFRNADTSIENLEKMKNEYVKTFFKECKGYKVAAQFHQTSLNVHSREEVIVKLGVTSDIRELLSDIDFKAIQEHKKSVKIYFYRNMFFSMFMDPVEYPNVSSNFNASMKEVDEFMNTIKEVPLIIETLYYGREFFVKYELDLKTKEENFKVYGQRTPAEDVTFKNAKDIEETERIILDILKSFSVTNSGNLLSFDANYLAEGGIESSSFRLSTAYGVSRVFQPKIIELVNDGSGLRTRWVIKYDKFDIDENRRMKTVEVGLEKRYEIAGSRKEIVKLPANATNVSVAAEERRLLIWRKVLNLNDVLRGNWLNRQKITIVDGSFKATYKVD